MSDTITIDRVTYNVLWRKTTEDYRAEGMPHLADDMERRGLNAMLGIQRPRGRKGFCTFEYLVLRGTPREGKRYCTPW